jgi:hypothetical protein
MQKSAALLFSSYTEEKSYCSMELQLDKYGKYLFIVFLFPTYNLGHRFNS